MLRKTVSALSIVMLACAGVVAWQYGAFRSTHIERLHSQSQLAQTAAGTVEYRIAGNTGPDVLFLHGTPGGYDHGLNEPGFRTITPSRPGYLRTPIEVGYTPAQQAQAYAALLDHLGIAQVLVMGASGGGPSAISFAALFPERTRALILIEAVSAPLPDDDIPMPAFMQSDFGLWAVFSAMDMVSGPRGMVSMMIPDPANQARILESESRLGDMGELLWNIWPPSQRRAGMENDLLQFQSLHLPIEHITAPVLLIHGTADVNVPFEHSKGVKQLLPDAKLHAIEGADHMMPFTHEEELSATIDAFLRETADTTR